MAKSQKNQTYVLKIHSRYLAKYDWDLSLRLEDVRKDSQMVVSLGSSQVLRWITEIQDRQDDDIIASNLKSEIRVAKKRENSSENKQRIRGLYKKLYETQFQQDYMMLVMDSVGDYRRALKGFQITVDGRTVKYRRLLGTTGSIKKSTIIFVNENIYEELMKRINNGRDVNKEFVAAKLNAYMALTCSASVVVSWPRIIIVDDAITKFKHDVLLVDDSDLNREEPIVAPQKDYDLEYNVSDGMGFITPEFSAKWSEEINEGSVPLSGYNVRCSYMKGMVFTVDFKKFAEEVAGTYMIKDAYGIERDVRDADILMTTSMFKLWDSYQDYESYYENCMANHYDFSIAKSTPRKLRNVHTTNYQYLQDFNLTDDQIDLLIEPTINHIHDVLGGDWRKMILYLCGSGINDENLEYIDPMCRAIMANHDLAKDPCIRQKVLRMIQKRIRTAQIGVLDVEGDYAIVGNDPYSLLQSIFSMEITGLLKAGECYHKYWSDRNVEEIVLFRAPMTSHNNVCKLNVVATDQMTKWYEYIETCCIINSWDTTAIRLNGCDYDSDSVFATNNKVLLDAFEFKPTLMCLQQKASKTIPTEADFIKSEINGFGDTIGSITNRATNMISLRSQFAEGSEEYALLSYRIDTMMNFQQNAIDRIKGIISRPIPKTWLSVGANKISDEDSSDEIYRKELNRRVAADKKPYFFIHRYSALKREYDKYMRQVSQNSICRFGRPLNELIEDPSSHEEEEFVNNYYRYLPVSEAPGIINQICWKIESVFKTCSMQQSTFDVDVLKSDAEYSQQDLDDVKIVLDEYNDILHLIMKNCEKNDSSGSDVDVEIEQLKSAMKDACYMACPDSRVLANILLDIGYSEAKYRSVVWDVCGEQLVENVSGGALLEYPVPDKDGDFMYRGNAYKVVTYDSI